MKVLLRIAGWAALGSASLVWCLVALFNGAIPGVILGFFGFSIGVALALDLARKASSGEAKQPVTAASEPASSAPIESGLAESGPAASGRSAATPKPNRWARPVYWMGLAAGVVVGSLLFQGVLTQTIERLQRGELSTKFYESSVMAEAGAERLRELSESDLFYQVSLHDMSINGRKPVDDPEKSERWTIGPVTFMWPGRLGVTYATETEDWGWQDFGEPFDIREVKWEVIPNVVAESRAFCRTEYQRDIGLESVRIRAADGQLEIRYYGSINGGESCDLRYTADGEFLGVIP